MYLLFLALTLHIHQGILSETKHAVFIALMSSPVAQCAARHAAMCTYGGWFRPHARHSVRMTYRPSAALQLLGSLTVSHNKFLRANK